MVEKQGVSLDEILQGTVDIIPDAGSIRTSLQPILLEEHIFTSRNFRETPWKQAQDVVVNGTVKVP